MNISNDNNRIQKGYIKVNTSIFMPMNNKQEKPLNKSLNIIAHEIKKESNKKCNE